MINNYISRLQEYISEGYCLEHVSISKAKTSDRVLIIELKCADKSTKIVTYRDDLVPMIKRFIKKEYPNIPFIES